MKDKCLALIPARGGSKRIPNKNIINFYGKPIITYSIKAAYKSKLFDEVMVSTDSKKIADIAKFCGADVPFLRSIKNSNNISTIYDVVKEVIEEYKKINISFKYVCVIFATSPLLQIKNIIKGFELLKKGNYSSVITVTPFSFPIQRAFKIVNNKVDMIHPENKLVRSQDLPIAYKDAGQFNWIDINNIKDQNSIVNNNTSSIILSELESQDIDTPDDLIIAKIKYKYIKSKGII